MTPMESAYCVQSSFIWGTVWIVPKRGSSQAYKKVLEKMQGKRVVIRTLDVSEEPEISQWRYGDRVNPAMGFRAIRFSLRRAGFVFDTASGNFAGVRLWESCGSISGCDIRRGGYKGESIVATSTCVVGSRRSSGG